MNKPESRTMLARCSGVLLLAGLIGAAGCASGGGKHTSGQGAQGGAGRQPDRQLDSVSQTALRETALAQLNQLAVSGPPEVRANALEAMLWTPSRARPLVRAALHDSNVGVRAIAAMCVGRAPLTDLVDDAAMLVGDESPMVRVCAAYALARCGRSPDLTPVGRALFDDTSARVRSQAAFVLGEIGDASALPMLAEAASAPTSLLSPAESRLLHLQIAEAMVKCGNTEAIHEIRAALYPSRPEDLESAALAAQIIGEVRDQQSVDQLVYLTARKDAQGRMPAEIRLAAAGSLAVLGLPNGSFIAEEFVTSDDATLRAQAAYVLGRTSGTGTLSTLAGMLADPEPRVQVAACGAIVRITEGGTRMASGGEATGAGGSDR